MYWVITYQDEGSRRRFSRWPGSRYKSPDECKSLLFDILIAGAPYTVLPDGTYAVTKTGRYGDTWISYYKIREVKR